ncbi:MAG: hypothetical protein HY747_01050, partial [Elusimicrobia bacterium]|nr:hypothetical protein [Elusimicrobiota bacterium]
MKSHSSMTSAACLTNLIVFAVTTAFAQTQLKGFISDSGGGLTDPDLTPGASIVHTSVGQVSQISMASAGSQALLGYLPTLASVAQSTDLIRGLSVAQLDSSVDAMSILRVTTAASNVSFALATASVQGIVLVGSIFEITPSVAFFPQATLTIRFDSTTVADPSLLAIYRFDGTLWSSATIANQAVLDGVDPRIMGNITSASLYALFIRQPQDRLSPITRLVMGNPKFGEQPIFITRNTPLGFLVVDDLFMPGDGLGQGVAQTFFAIDSTASFNAYAGSFTVA